LFFVERIEERFQLCRSSSRACRCVSIQLSPDLRGGLRFMSSVFGRGDY
jgi:hypothetical protein